MSEYLYKEDSGIPILGEYEFNNGDKYKGMMCQGQPFGDGTLYLTDGSLFTG